jgi:preprotein translocase subunit SecG
MYYALVAVYVLVCLVLSLVILLQQGRGGDIASAFGGSSSQAAFGARSGATLLTKATAIAAVLFMLFALTLSIIGQQGGTSSVVSGTPAPVAPATTTPAPAAPAATAPSPAAPQATPPAAPAK